MTWKERRKLKKRKKTWESFSKLLDRAISDLNRTTKFSEAYSVMENFIFLTEELFGSDDEEVNGMLDKLKAFLENYKGQIDALDRTARPLIEKTNALYNAEVRGDLTFDGDVEQWFSRTFPLVALHLRKSNT